MNAASTPAPEFDEIVSAASAAAVSSSDLASAYRATAGGDEDALEAYNELQFILVAPAVVKALTAVGIDCQSENGDPGDGVLAAGSVTVGGQLEWIIIGDGNGKVYSPGEIEAAWAGFAAEAHAATETAS